MIQFFYLLNDIYFLLNIYIHFYLVEKQEKQKNEEEEEENQINDKNYYNSYSLHFILLGHIQKITALYRWIKIISFFKWYFNSKSI